MGYDYYDYYGYSSSPYASSDVAAAGILGALGALIGIIIFICLAIYVIQVIAYWKLFTKAGEQGWKSIVPIYNLVILYKISGVSPWLLLIFLASFIPVIGAIAVFVLNIYQTNQLSKSFGKDIGYTIGLIFLAPILYMILAFGSATYIGPGGNNSNNNQPTTDAE